MNFDPDFKVTTFFEIKYLKNDAFRDKVTIEHQSETIPNISNGAMFGDLD